MNIAQIEQALGDDLADVICRIAHKNIQVGVNAEIKGRMCEFELCIWDKRDPIAELDAVYIVDEYSDWLTVVVKTGEHRFVMFHEYVEGSEFYKILVHCRVVNDNIMQLERLMYKDRNIDAHNVPELVQKKGEIYNTIPFDILMHEFYGLRHSDYSINLSYNSGKQWAHGDMVWDWFKTEEKNFISRRRP